ncbi:MAG TPA: DNA alkylation repair protein [Vicinamibacterales bacterium]
MSTARSADVVGRLARGAVADVLSSVRAELRTLPTRSIDAIRAVRRRHSAALAESPPSTVVDVAGALLSAGRSAERLIGTELLIARPDAIRRVRSADVEKWATGLDDWGSVDMYGVTVAGVAWREGCVPDRHVMRWAGSTDRWRRRLALVATVPLNSRARGGQGDTARTLRVCAALVDDRDDMVVKALSWALRELSKRDPRSVAAFLREHELRLASRVRREVKTKLETGRKVARAT